MSKYISIIKSNYKLAIDTMIYTITNVINKSIPLLLLPVLTRYLSPQDYGIVSMFNILVAFVVPIVGVNTNGAISRAYFDRDKFNFNEYVSNCFYILLASTMIVSIVFFSFSKSIERMFSVPSSIFFGVILLAFSKFVVVIVLALLQVKRKPIYFGIYQTIQTIANITLILIFVVYLHLTWVGSVYAQVFSFTLSAIIGLIVLLRKKLIGTKINFSYMKHAIAFGFPLLPHAVGGIIMTMTDRIFITNMVSVEATGIYSVGYQIGMVISLLTISFNQAYVPWLYAKLNERVQHVKVKIVKFTYIYFVCIILLAVILSIVSSIFMPIFIGERFNDANDYIIWIAIGYAFNGMYLMVTNYIFYSRKIGYLAIITTLAAVLNIILNYVLILQNGAVGASQATAIICLFQFVLTWIFASKAYFMPWNIFKFRL